MAQIQCSFFAHSLGHGTNIYLSLPTMSSCDPGKVDKPSHARSGKLPVLYLLHGYGNDYLSWPRYTSMDRYSEEQLIAMVTLDAGNRAFLNCSHAEQCFDFLAYELPDFLGANFPISTARSDSYLAGLSMGGYGTLVHGLSCPGHYAAIGAFSPAVRYKEYAAGRNLEAAVDLYALLEQAAAGKADLPRIFMSCGLNDSLYPDVAELAQALRDHGLDLQYEGLPGYEHEWRLWDGELQKFLSWLPRTDAMVKLIPHKI